MSVVPVYGHQEVIVSLRFLIKEKKLHSSLLLNGPSSVGKRQVALWLAQSLLCDHQKQTPCGNCTSCKNVIAESHSSILWIEPDGLSIKVATVHNIRSFLKLQSFSSVRVIIVDQSHLMNIQTQNALLKIVEEPPKNVYFIFVCDQLDQMISTMQSRMRHIRLNRLRLEDMRKIFPSHPDWLLKAGRGQVSQVSKWEGEKELSKEIFYFWNRMLNQQSMSAYLYSRIKDRKTALLVARTWQEILRDACLYQSKSLMHFYQKKNQPEVGSGDASSVDSDLFYAKQMKLYQQFAQLPSSLFYYFYTKTIDLEQDILSYVNTGMCFENYYNNLYKQIHEYHSLDS